MVFVLLVSAACAAPHARPPNGADRSRADLSESLLDLADLCISRYQAAYMNAALAAEDPRRLAVLALGRNEAAMNMRALALGPDPGRDLVDLYVWSRVAEVACRNRTRLRPDVFVDVCDEVYAPAHERVSALAREWISPEKMARIDAAVDGFLKDHPDIPTASLLRLVDLDDRRDSLGDSSEDLEDLHDADDMFAPVSEATRQIEQTRITGQQMVWLLSRSPTTMGWEVQAQVDLALAGPTVTAGLADLRRGAEDLERVSDSVGRLSESIGGLSQRVSGDDGLSGLARESILLAGLMTLAMIVAATIGALVVVHRMHHLRRRER